MIPCGIETGLVVPGPNALARLSVAAVSVHDRRSIAPSKNSLASAPQLRQTLQSQRPAKLAERQPGLETSHTPQNGVGYQPEDEAEEYRPCLDWHNVVVWQSKNLAPISSRAEPCSLRDGCTAVPGRATGSVQSRVEVIAENVVLLDKNRNGQGSFSSGDDELGVSEADVVF